MLKNYLKIAWKVLLRRKFFTFISLFGISFTLLVLMIGTAVLDHLFAPYDPEPFVDRTLYVTSMSMVGPHASRGSSAGYGFLDRWVRTLSDVERVSVLTLPDRQPIYHRGDKLMTFTRHTDGEFWRIMNFEFLEGGPFTVEDDHDGRRVAVINATTRERFFDGEPAVGKTFRFDGGNIRVVGVVEDVPMPRFMAFAEVWLPNGTLKGDRWRHDVMGDFVAIILARERGDFPAIKAEFQSRLGQVQLPSDFESLYAGADTMFESWARILSSDHQESSNTLLLRGIMVGAMLLFMLLPTVNLVNINLSRIMERASEIGVRKAFGASSRTPVGQFVVENVVLTLVGGLLGLLFSAIALMALNGSGAIPYADFRLNLRIFGYGMLLAAFFGVLSGVYPAWRMSRLHPADALRGRTA